jgi:hypothetical protein
MMKTKHLLCAGALALGGSASTALAIPIVDTVNPTDILLTFGSVPNPCAGGFTCASGSITFTHNILDDGFTIGSIVNSASLVIHLTDSGGPESYQYLIGAGQTFTGGNIGSSQTDPISLNAASIADLQADGLLTITMNATSGNLSFADATWTAQVTPASSGGGGGGGGGGNGIAAVPEPMTLALLGVSAFGLAITRQRKIV